MKETQEIQSYKRRKKGGKRKCVVVQGYTRRKPMSSKPSDASDGRRIPVESRSDSERDRPVG